VQRHKDCLNVIGRVQHVLLIGYTVTTRTMRDRGIGTDTVPMRRLLSTDINSFFQVEIAPLVHSEKFDMKRIEVDDL
jgi:hypothetical protein